MILPLVILALVVQVVQEVLVLVDLMGVLVDLVLVDLMEVLEDLVLVDLIWVLADFTESLMVVMYLKEIIIMMLPNLRTIMKNLQKVAVVEVEAVVVELHS